MILLLIFVIIHIDLNHSLLARGVTICFVYKWPSWDVVRSFSIMSEICRNIFEDARVNILLHYLSHLRSWNLIGLFYHFIPVDTIKEGMLFNLFCIGRTCSQSFIWVSVQKLKGFNLIKLDLLKLVVILLRLIWKLEAWELLFKYYRKVVPYCCRNRAVAQPAFHIIALRGDTSRLTYHGLIFSAFQEQGKQLIRRMTSQKYYQGLLLLINRNL